MQELHAALLALQKLDAEIDAAQKRLEQFTPRLQELEAPVVAIEKDLATTRTKLEEFRAEYIRLEKNAQQKQERLHAYQEKLTRARTARDEAAVRAEVDLVSRALDADRTDIKSMGEQTTRTDMKTDELQKQLDKARADIAQQREQLMTERAAAETELAQLRDQRENEAQRIDPQSRRVYDRVRTGKSRSALAPLTAEGACGSCFNILPVQEQAEVRRGERLSRCEGCGAILYSE
jgi:predicted  nucleic acid-binding Zn-ribbon protein